MGNVRAADECYLDQADRNPGSVYAQELAVPMKWLQKDKAHGSPIRAGEQARTDEDVTTAPHLDDHGQPYEARFNRARRAEREISELLGLCKGFLADGELSNAEIGALSTWMQRHPDGGEDWIVQQVSRRVRIALEDGFVSEEERVELSELLHSFVGGTAELILGDDPRSTELPLDHPAPNLQWEGAVYVFTGKFAFGTRKDCERASQALGATIESAVTQQTNYLVIGTFGSRDWVHTNYGRKIQKAATYRQKGIQLAIVCEDHWRKDLP
jgi:NAD-dependent DNA ligase